MRNCLSLSCTAIVLATWRWDVSPLAFSLKHIAYCVMNLIRSLWVLYVGLYLLPMWESLYMPCWTLPSQVFPSLHSCYELCSVRVLAIWFEVVCCIVAVWDFTTLLEVTLLPASFAIVVWTLFVPLLEMIACGGLLPVCGWLTLLATFLCALLHCALVLWTLFVHFACNVLRAGQLPSSFCICVMNSVRSFCQKERHYWLISVSTARLNPLSLQFQADLYSVHLCYELFSFLVSALWFFLVVAGRGWLPLLFLHLSSFHLHCATDVMNTVHYVVLALLKRGACYNQ